jgi:hypothetical protein
VRVGLHASALDDVRRDERNEGFCAAIAHDGQPQAACVQPSSVVSSGIRPAATVSYAYLHGSDHDGLVVYAFALAP